MFGSMRVLPVDFGCEQMGCLLGRYELRREVRFEEIAGLADVVGC